MLIVAITSIIISTERNHRPAPGELQALE